MGRVDTDPFSTDTSSTTEPTSQNRSSYAMNVQKLLRTSLFSVLALLLVGGLATAQAQSPGSGEVYVFDADGNPVEDSNGDVIDFENIQAGIDALAADNSGESGNNRTGSNESGTVLVGDGTFTVVDGASADGVLEVDVDGVTIESDGRDPANTAIEGAVTFDLPGSKSATTTFAGFNVQPDGSSQSDLSGGRALIGIADVSSSNSTVNIEDNVLDVNEIRGTASGGGFGFGIEYTVAASKLNVLGNEILDGRTGVLVASAGDADVEGNTITGMVDADNLSFPSGAAVKVAGGQAGANTLNITGNQIGTSTSGNERGILIENTSASLTATVEENNIVGNTVGLEVQGQDGGGADDAVGSANSITATDNYWGDSAGPTDEVTMATDGNVSGSSNRGGGDIIRIYNDDQDGTTSVATSGTQFAFIPFVASSISNAGADGDPGSIAIENSDRGLYDTELFVNASDTDGNGTVGSSTSEFDTIDDAIGVALPGETIVVKGRGATNYTSTVVSGLGNTDSRVGSLSGLAASVTFTALSDISSRVDVASIDLNQSFSESGNSLRIAFDRRSNGSFDVTGTFELSQGLATLNTSNALRVNGGTLLREDGSLSTGDVASASARVAFNGDVDVTYDPTGSSIESGAELPEGPTINTLTVGTGTNSFTGRLTVAEDTVAITGTGKPISFNSSASATFQGDLELTADDAELEVPNSSGDVTIAGTLAFSGVTDLDGTGFGTTGTVLDVDGTFNGDQDVDNDGTNENPSPGNVEVRNVGSTGGTDDTGTASEEVLVDASGGQVSITDLTFQLNSTFVDNGSAENFEVGLQHSSGASNTTDLDIQGTVDTDVRGTGDSGDEITVRFDDGGGSNVTIAVGGGDDFGILSGYSNDLAGTLSFQGDATATHPGGETLQLSSGGTVEVTEGNTLTVANEASSTTLTHDFGATSTDDGSAVSAPGSFAGGGTVELGGSSPGGHEFTVDVNRSGSSADDVTGQISPTLVANSEVTFDESDDDGSTSGDTQDNVGYSLGEVTANSPITFANALDLQNSTDGSVTIPSGGELQTGTTSFAINNGSLNLTGGNAVVGNGITVDLEADIQGSSTFTSSSSVTIGTDFSVSSDANVSVENADLTFNIDGTTSTIDLGKTVEFGSLDINKLAGQTVITGSPLEVSGGVDVANPGSSPTAALKLEDDLRVLAGSSFDLSTTVQAGNTANATSGDGAIVFTNGGTLQSTGGNDPTIGNVTVGLDSQTGGNAVTVADAFDFSDDIVLANGDLQVDDASPSTVIDLSPEVDTARVEVQTDVAGGSITTPNNDTFNGDEVKYNLAYTGDGSATVGTEAVADTTLQDFEVLESATATLGKEVEPSGSVVVESDAELANGGGGILNLSEAGQSTLAGQVGVTVTGRGERVVDGGDNGVFEGSVTAGDSTSVATITADEVTGDIVASDSGQVIFDGTVSVGGALDANTEGTIDLAGGDVTVEGDVTLTQDPDEEEGRTSLSLGDNDLTIENSNFNGGDGVEYSAGSGAIIFDTDGNVTSNGETISNITVAEGSTPKLRDGAGNADTLAFDGEATLNGSFGGSGTLLATGSTLTVDAEGSTQDDGSPDAVDVPKFVMNSDAETEVIDGSTADTDQSFLNVTDSLRFESGDFVHSTDVRASNVFEFAPESEGAVSVTAEAGQLELNGADALLQADLPVPALAAVGGPGNGSDLVANEAGDAFDILVGRSLELGSALSTTANNTGSLVLTGGNDVELTRLNNYSAGDVLDEAPSFEGSETTYDLVYAGDAGDPSTSGTEVTVTSGFEAVGESSRIDSLTIDFSDGETRLNLESNADRFEGAVTANTALQVLSGDLDYGTAETRRDLAIADGGEVLRAVDSDGNSGNLVGNNSEGTQAIPVEGDNYTVAYRSTNTSSALTPSVAEFPEGRSLALRVQAGVQGDGSPNQGDFTFDLGSRSVDSVDVTAIGSGSEARVARALDVGGNANVSGGGTVGAEGSGGNLGAQDSLSVGGAATISGSATLNGADIAGSLTSEGGTANNVDVAGDVTIEAGGSLGSAVRLDGEGVQGLTLGDDVDQADVTSLTVDQSATADTETPRVELSGGDLNMESGGNGLTLNGGLIVAQNDELIDLNDAGFDRNVEDGETSHIVGSVRQTVAPGGTGDQVRANFPVGTEAGSLRSYELIFPNGLAETELTVDHVTTDPGTEGLPVEDETGVTVQSTPGYRWEVTSDQNVGLSQNYEVSLQADSLDFSEVPADNFRLVRRGNVEGSAFSLIGTGENYSNFRTQQDGEAQIRTSSATEDITTAGVIFTVGQPTAETAEGLQIAGQVNYPTVSDGNVVDGRALEGVEVEATSGDVTVTDTTDADGNFTISGLDSGDYEVTANVDRDVSNVSIGDAQRTVSGFAGTEPFAGAFQEEVADVNASGTANATDALRIAFFDLGSISSFEAGSFLVDTTEVTLGSESESGVSIRVAEFGDADLSGGSSDSGGSTSLATTTVSPKSSAQTAAKSATESASDANRVAAGETFEVPVRVDRGAEVGSYSLSLEYDTEKATFEGISSGRDDIITNGSKEDGTLQVGWFDRSGESTLELTGGSELVTLRFSAAEGIEGAEFAPEITSGEINGPGAKAVAAGVETQAVRIAKPAPDEFALNGSYPNPASQQATVEMDLPVRAQVTVEVYNTLGQRVQTVEQSMSAGAGQTVQLDASQLASGQYFYRVKASLDGNQTRETGRLTIVK